ncbi:MAG: hypothetical protein AB1689_28155 [Thermodesulfobacteriota bacterium]
MATRAAGLVSGFAAAFAAGVLAFAGAAAAQPIPISEFAPRNVDLAVARSILQTVSQLPPVTNVGLSYRYDPELDTYVAVRDDLGSGMVPSARFARKGSFTSIVSFAWFELDDFAGQDSTAVVVDVPADRFNPEGQRLTLGVAARVKTEVYVVRLAGRYTFLDNMDVGLTLPLIITDVTSRYLVQQLQGQGEIDQFARLGVRSPDVGNTLIDTRLNRIAFPGGFNEGTNFDFGNMVLDTKYGFPLELEDVAMGAQLELRLPTASQARFTGTDSTSLRALLLASYQSEVLGFYLAGGYEQDFSTDVLSNGSISASLTAQILPALLAEVGMNANFYRKDIDLFDSNRFAVVLPSTRIVAGSSQLGTKEVNFGGGIRFNPVSDLSVSAYATTPVSDDGYRPGEIVAVSLDYPF